MRLVHLLGTCLLATSSLAANAVVLVQEDFESRTVGTRLADFGPGWLATTFAFATGAQPGFSASGTNYLNAPSRIGSGTNTRYGYFDASSAFNARPSAENLLIADVRMFVPKVDSSTYGGMVIFDQTGNTVAIIGVDMLSHRTLTNATNDVDDILVGLDQYNDFRLLADYGTGLVEYIVNGTNIGSSQMSAASLAAGFGDFDFYNNGFNANVSVPFRYDNYIVQTVPEAETLALFGAGLAVLAVAVRRRRTPRA